MSVLSKSSCGLNDLKNEKDLLKKLERDLLWGSSFIKHLLNACYVPSTIFGVKNTRGNRTKPANLTELAF